MLGVDPDEAPSMYAERLEILLRALSSSGWTSRASTTS